MNIHILTYALITGMAIELLVYFVPFIWNNHLARNIYLAIHLCTLGFITGGMVVAQLNVLVVVVAVISLYRIFNVIRVLERRINEHHLRSVAIRSSYMLIFAQLLILALNFFYGQLNVSTLTVMLVLAVTQVSAAALLLLSVIRRIKHTRITEGSVPMTSNELPTVSVAIPARNETEDLEECLRSLIANDYPKLEILVLDDCSQMRRTPEIIRSFAHDGVRFVQGETPDENWLAKNQAYDKLADEANGEIILFCGVDMRFEPHSIYQLVQQLVSRNKRMISLVPLRENTREQRSLVQAARYFWELVPPRKLFKRPAVLSSCWLIYRDDLKKFGGFDAVSRAILPEAYFAKRTLEHDGYSFLRASQDASVYSTKSYDEQRQTAIRTRYPQLHKRPENVLFFTAAGLYVFVGPFILFLISLLNSHQEGAVVSVLAAILLVATHVIVMSATRVNTFPFALISFLPMIFTDIVLMHVSMFRYEFSEVLWKGRNVCVPVMHVIPSLPKLDD